MVNISSMIESKIEYKNKLIKAYQDDDEYKDYKYLAKEINNDLLPLLQDVNNELFDIAKTQNISSNIDKIEKLMKFEKKEKGGE